MKALDSLAVMLLVAVFAAGSGCRCDQAANVWWSDGHSPSEYGAAATAALVELDGDEAPLTVGSVVKLLGTPSSASMVGYTFDEAGNVLGSEDRLQIHYEGRWTTVSFTAAGSLECALHDAGVNERHGNSLLAWPRSMDAVRAPLSRGPFRSTAEAKSLLDAAGAMARTWGTETAWYRDVTGALPRTDEKRAAYGGPCHAETLVADALTENLAFVVFRIKGQHRAFYDSWWLRDAEGQWQRVDLERANEVLASQKNRDRSHRK